MLLNLLILLNGLTVTLHIFFIGHQAIWFTEGRASQTDNPADNVVFGAADRWKGLGVFLDSFDNDGQVWFCLSFSVLVVFLRCLKQIKI